MAAIDTVASFGRIATLADPSIVLVTINANGATYTQGTGLPIDLTAVLTQGAPFSQGYINPADVVGIVSILKPSSPGGYDPKNLTLGSATYTTLAGASVRPIYQLATCPATVQLYSGGTEFATGACSEVFTMALLVARGGTNIN